MLLRPLTALKVLKAEYGVRIDGDAVVSAFKRVKIPGRFEKVRSDYGEFILDCTHNPAGAKPWQIRSMPPIRDKSCSPCAVCSGIKMSMRF